MTRPTVWISVMEAATRLAVTHQTVRNLIARGKLKAKKLGGFGPYQFTVVDARSVTRLAKERADARR